MVGSEVSASAGPETPHFILTTRLWFRGRAVMKPGMASVWSSDAECLKGAKCLGGREAREVTDLG